MGQFKRDSNCIQRGYSNCHMINRKKSLWCYYIRHLHACTLWRISEGKRRQTCSGRRGAMASTLFGNWPNCCAASSHTHTTIWNGSVNGACGLAATRSSMPPTMTVRMLVATAHPTTGTMASLGLLVAGKRQAGRVRPEWGVVGGGRL